MSSSSLSAAPSFGFHDRLWTRPAFIAYLPPTSQSFYPTMTPSIDTMTRKSVLITGCSAGGIGSALVEAFQKRNLHVFATARDLSKMTHLDGLPNMTLLPLDPTSVLNVQTAFETVQAHIGGTLDYLVNNADQMIVTPTLNFDIKIVKKLYDINVWGMVRVT